MRFLNMMKLGLSKKSIIFTLSPSAALRINLIEGSPKHPKNSHASTPLCMKELTKSDFLDSPKVNSLRRTSKVRRTCNNTHNNLQLLRRSVQISVILLLILIPLVNYYGIKVEQKDDYTIEQSKPLSLIHSVFKGQQRDKVIALSHKVKGSVWTINIFGVRISDPLAVLESTTTAMYFYWPMLLSLVVPIVFTIILGRVYCGWLCPMNLMLELNEKVRRLLERVGYNTRDIKFKCKTRYLVLAGGLIAAYFAGMPFLSLIYPPAVISREIFYKIYNGFWGNGLLLIAAICFFELILSRRWWCRYICPGGAVYTGLSRFRLLKIKRNDVLCDRCGDCVPVCPYDLKPMTRELGAECDQCGLCTSACHAGALQYTFAKHGESSDRNSTANKPAEVNA